MFLLFLDTETTGLDPVRNGLIQISFQIVDKDCRVSEMEFDSYIKPFKGDLVSEQALEINGISLDDLGDFPSPAEVYNQIKDIFDKYIDKYKKDKDFEDTFLCIGHNIHFDLRFLHQFWNKNGDKYLSSYIKSSVDTLSLVNLLRMEKKIHTKSSKLQEVAESLGYTGKNWHNSLEDVRATRFLFDYFVDNYIIE